jgi:hypothetical protein
MTRIPPEHPGRRQHKLQHRRFRAAGISRRNPPRLRPLRQVADTTPGLELTEVVDAVLRWMILKPVKDFTKKKLWEM